MTTPLDGVTVLDLGQIYNGPYATFLLAMSGARVIKVESLIGEALRGRGEKSSAAYPFALLNQTKESITLDLKHEEGKALFLELVKSADVVVENYGPDTMDRLGLSAGRLLEANPRLIYASGSGYGREGEHRDYLAMDVTVQAMAGVMSLTGTEETLPLKAGPAICDFFGGVHLYGAIVTKLFERERTGEGGIVDVAMQDTVLPTLATGLGAYYYHDRQVQPRTGNRHPAGTMAPYNVYPASDGHVAIICIRNGRWRSLTTVMGREDLLGREEFETMESRGAHADEIDEIVSGWTMSKARAELLAKLQQGGVPGAAVRNVEEVARDTHLHARGMLRNENHEVLGDIVLMDSPINVATGRRVKPRMAPALGAQSAEVCRSLVGLDDAQIERLVDAGVISLGEGSGSE
ncbi:MAG: CoA transferase [Gammaproteobacteria bacterium]|nr:CoA transferase [Gammaproteobacteria bacterium]